MWLEEPCEAFPTLSRGPVVKQARNSIPSIHSCILWPKFQAALFSCFIVSPINDIHISTCNLSAIILKDFRGRTFLSKDDFIILLQLPRSFLQMKGLW